MSVVENVVYAHDLEKKWIQSHPAVLYDAYLIDKAYEKIIEEHFNDKGYIPEEVLSVEGVEIGSFGKISLASDADIIFLLKQSDLRNDDEEYFHRTNRKHPLWKTEAEFHAIFNDQTSIVRELNKVIHDIAKSQEQRYTEVNEEVLKMLEDEREKFNDENEIKGESADDRRILSLETKNQQIELVCIFKDFSEKQGIPFDYVIIYANQFNSSFREVEFSKMRFSLPTVEGTKEFGEVSTVNTPKESDDSEFFYIFCPKKNNGEKVEVSELIEDLMNFAGKMNARTVRKKVK